MEYLMSVLLLSLQTYKFVIISACEISTPGCLSCTANDRCQTCSDGWYLKSENEVITCETECGDNYFVDTETRECRCKYLHYTL